MYRAAHPAGLGIVPGPHQPAGQPHQPVELLNADDGSRRPQSNLGDLRHLHGHRHFRKHTRLHHCHRQSNVDHSWRHDLLHARLCPDPRLMTARLRELARRLRRRNTRTSTARDESGVTLVELSVATATLLVLFAMTVPIIDTLFSTIARVNNTYTNVNQLLPVSTNLQRFIRSAVSPGPTSAGVPDPAFVPGAILPNSVTFYTNIGDTKGPAKIVASCPSTAAPGLCELGSTFTVTEAPAIAGSCPPTGSNPCRWGTPQTLITVNGVSNSTDAAPLFLYTTLTNTATSSGITSTTSQIGS